nr:glycerol-3-phosphate 1-O-acyltransferase PlsY [Deinobacterium chartae]
MILPLAYLFGSVPAGVLVARVYKLDIRKVGSGNIGATNVLRALGWGPALLVAFFDIFKGGLAVLIARALGLDDLLIAACALAAVIGHNYSVFLGFRGGKGVATSFGTILVIDPLLGLGTAVVAIAVMVLTRFVSAGSIIGGLVAVVLSIAMGLPLWKILVCVGLALLIVWTHRENIGRLRAGTERRLGEKTRAPEAAPDSGPQV